MKVEKNASNGFMRKNKIKNITEGDLVPFMDSNFLARWKRENESPKRKKKYWSKPKDDVYITNKNIEMCNKQIM